MFAQLRIPAFLFLFASITGCGPLFVPDDGLKGGGEDCRSNNECESGCCYDATSIHPFCSTTYENCMGYDETDYSSETGTDTGTETGAGVAYVQFYADPEVFNGNATVITDIIINGQSYRPLSTKGDCSQHYQVSGQMVEGRGSPTVLYTIKGRNYGSLDTAFGAEYTPVEQGGAFYENELEPGCNTLEVYWAQTNQIFLRVTQ